MENALVSYQFDEKPVRVVMIAAAPWFVANDVATVLGYRDAFNMARNLDDDEKGTHIVSTLGGVQEVSIISESGLYAAVLKSRREEARRFRKWVTSEVLPAIRKQGRFELGGLEPNDQLGDDFDPNNLNAKVAVVREARRLFGPKRARSIWVRVGLPLGIADARASYAGDDLAEPLRDLLTSAESRLTTSEIARGLGLDAEDGDARRRVTELMRLLGWYRKRARRGADLVWAWFPVSEEQEG